MNRFLLKGLASVLTMAVMFGTVSCSDDDDSGNQRHQHRTL